MAYNAKLGRDLTPEEESFLARNPNDEDRMSAALTNVTSGRRYDSQDTSQYNTVGDYVGGGMGDGGGYGGARNFGLPSLGPVPVPNLPTPEKPPPFAYDSYQAAQPFTYQDWRAPSVEQVMADPSYQWRKQQGEESLQRWAAAKGTLNASDTATGLINYGQNAASQEYGNVYGREYDIYRTNRAGALDAYNVNEGNRFNAYQANFNNAVNPLLSLAGAATLGSQNLGTAGATAASTANTAPMVSHIHQRSESRHHPMAAKTAKAPANTKPKERSEPRWTSC